MWYWNMQGFFPMLEPSLCPRDLSSGIECLHIICTLLPDEDHFRVSLRIVEKMPAMLNKMLYKSCEHVTTPGFFP